jgi:hypothetical protein
MDSDQGEEPDVPRDLLLSPDRPGGFEELVHACLGQGGWARAGAPAGEAGCPSALV